MPITALFNEPTMEAPWAALQLAAITTVIAGLSYFSLKGLRQFDIGRHVMRRTRIGVSALAACLTLRVLVPQVASFRPLSQAAILTLQIALILSFAFVLLRVGAGLRGWLDEHFDISAADNLRSRRVRTQVAFIERIFDVLVVIVTAPASWRPPASQAL